MADYVVRVEAATSDAESKLSKLEKHLNNIEKDVKVNVSLPNLEQTTNALKQFGEVSYKVGAAALDLSRKLNVGPGAVLNDLEEIFHKVGDAAKVAAGAIVLVGKASPGRILSTSFDVATASAIRLSESVSRIGFVLFGITQSVGVLKQAFGGFFDDTIGREIRLRESLLRTKTTLISTADVVRNGLRLSDPTAALQALDQPIEKTLENIRRRSLDIAGTTSDAIVQVFGVVAGQIGAIGGSLKDAEDLAITFAGALGTIGMADPMLANQEIRSILTGNIDQNSVLARSLGITNEDIAKAKRSSEGLVAWLTKRLEGFGAGQKLAAQGFAGIVSNIQEVREEMSRTFGAGLLDPLLTGLTTLYTRLQLVFDQLLKISRMAGQSVGTIASVALEGAGNAPIAKGFDEATQSRQFDVAAQAFERFKALVTTEALKLQGVFSRLFNEITEGALRIGAGLAALAQGFAYFKFEQFKVLAASFANIATVLNNSVVPALQGILTLYGQFLQLPVINYLSQLAAQHAVLEKIGVNSVVRLIAVWGLYRQSINTAIGWVRNAANFIKTAFNATLEAIASAIQGLGGTVQGVLENIVGFVTRVTVRIVLTVSALIREIGVRLMQLAVSLQASFAGQPLGAFAVKLAEVASALINVDRTAKKVGTEIQAMGQKAAASLRGIKRAADEAANATRNLSATLGGKLLQGVKALGEGIKGMVFGMLRFQAIMLVVEYGVAALTEAFGRFQRQQEQAKASQRTAEALRRLSTVYKDLGDDIDESTRRARAFEEQIVEARYTQNEQELESLTGKLQELNKLKAEIAQPGFQSWGEFSNFIMPDFITGIEIFLEDLQKIDLALMSFGQGVQQGGNLFQEGIGNFTSTITAFNDSVNGLFIEAGKLIPDFLKDFEWLVDGIGNAVKELVYSIIPGARALGYFIDLRDRINNRNIDRNKTRQQELNDENERIAAARDRERQAQNIQLAQKARTDGLKQLKEYERQLDGQLFQERQNLAQKEVELFKSAETFRIDQIEKANKKRIEGEEGASEVALSALTEWISTKAKAELEAQTIEKELRIELDNLERGTADYRYEVEKRIAQIRMQAAQYDAQVRAGAGATPEGGATGQFRVGSTGRSTGPHLDINGPDPEKVVAEAVQIIQAWQQMNVEYIELSNAGIDVKGMRDVAQLTEAVRREQRAHASRSRNNSIDIAVPSGTPVPVMTGPIQSSGDARGYYATSLASGNSLLHGLRPAVAGNPADLVIPSGAGSYWEGYMKRLSNLEGGYGLNGSAARNASTNARGYFQLIPSTEADLRRRGKGGLADQMLSTDFRTAAMGAWGYMQELGPSIRDMMAKGDTAGLDRRLNQRWTSLPGGTEAASGSRLAEANAYMSGRTAGGGAPPAPVLPPAVPEVALGDLNKIVEDTANTRNRIGDLMRRSAELRKQILDANSAEQFENIAKNLFPKLQLEQYDDKMKELDATMRVIAETSALVYDPDKMALAVEQRAKEAIAARELQQYIEGVGKLQGTTEKQRADLIKQAQDKYKEYLADVERENKLKAEILDKEKQTAAIVRVIQDTRKIYEDAQGQALDAGFAARRATMMSDDYRGQRRLNAEQEIARYRLQLQQQGIGGPELEARLKEFETAAYNVAEGLAEVDEAAASLAERLSLAREAATSLTDGYKGMLSSVMKGENIRDSVQQMSQNIAGKFTDMFLDYAFKPIEQQLEKAFRDFFGVDDAQEKNTSAVRELTAKLQELIAKLGSPAAPSDGLMQPPGTTVPKDFQTLPYRPGAAPEKVDVLPWDGKPGEVTPLSQFKAPPVDFSQTEESFKKFDAVTKNYAEGTNTNADKASEGTDKTLGDMQKFATGLAGVATAALSIVGGVQSIKKGGAYNVLSGIGSIFMGVGGALGGFSGMFGGAGKRAAGGPVSAKTPYLVGERGPELFVPSSYGQIRANNQLRQAMGTAPGTRQDRMALDLKFDSRVINGVEYISRDQLDAAMEQTRRRATTEGAKRGMNLTLDKIKQSPATRSRLGIR